MNAMRGAAAVLAVVVTGILAGCAIKLGREETRSRVLIAYFTTGGHTKGIAEKIEEVTGGDMFEIVPEVPYTEADLDEHNDNSRAIREHHDRSLRPALGTRVEHFAAYDTVFLGFPIWWYSAPPIIHSFLEAHDTKGKTIVPFVISSGSGYGEIERDLRESAPEARFLPGKVVSGFSKKQVEQWVRSL